MANSDHIGADLLAGYRRRTLSPRELLAVDDHLAACPVCHRLLAQLYPDAERHLDHALSSEPRRHKWWLGAVALAACLLAGALLFHPKPSPSPVPRVVAKAELPLELKTLRDEAARTGHVELPVFVARLAGEPSVLRGEVRQARHVRLESPLGTATASSTPEFRWQPVVKADWYRVSIFDSAFHLIQESPVLRQPDWTPPKPLPPGQAYLWQLTMRIGGANVTAPEPPAPEAKFVVLPENEIRRLRDLAAKYSGDPMLLGVLYFQAGAIEEAGREWQAAMDEGHPEAAPLLREYKATRQ